MITNSVDKTEGVEILERAIEAMTEYLTANGGSLVVKMQPKAVSETDEAELADLMSRMEKENAEVSGDDDDEE
jgi:translation initiation factor 2 subunit 1